MFVSVHYLHTEMGVDESIARFFVDRKIPEGNAFWRNRLLYIGRGNGFKSLPVYYDLLHRIGIPVTELLNEEHVQLMEKLMHYAISVEFEEMTHAEELEKITALFAGRIRNQDFFWELINYLSQPVLHPLGKLGMPVPALNRADTFLFILCDLPLSDTQLDQAIRNWYALHTTYLLMDDIHDYKHDKEKAGENSITELGDGEIGFDRAFGILDSNVKTLQNINPVLSLFFEQSLADLHSLIP